jgi:TPR repeat protein
MIVKNTNPFRSLRIILSALSVLVLTWTTHAQAQSYEDGRSAYVRGDYARAQELLLPLAEEGNAGAQTILGIMYDYGHGVEKDEVKALDWYLRAAVQGDPAVQYKVGDRFFQGIGTEQNYREAFEWWELAASGGYSDAQFNLGLMYYRGLVTPPDFARAAELFQRAAEQENSYAQYSLAVMYSFGEGVDKSYGEALKWLEKSAAQGLVQAQFNLGVFYENGYGVDKNAETAHACYEKAAAEDLSEAKAKLAGLTSPVEGQTTSLAQMPVENADTLDENQTHDIRQQEWVLQQPSEYYTLQLVSVLKEQDIVNFIRAHGIESESAYVAVMVNGVTHYNALYGVYRSYESALEAAAEMPDSLAELKPWARSFRVLQGMLGQNRD